MRARRVLRDGASSRAIRSSWASAAPLARKPLRRGLERGEPRAAPWSAARRGSRGRARPRATARRGRRSSALQRRRPSRRGRAAGGRSDEQAAARCDPRAASASCPCLPEQGAGPYHSPQISRICDEISPAFDRFWSVHGCPCPNRLLTCPARDVPAPPGAPRPVAAVGAVSRREAVRRRTFCSDSSRRSLAASGLRATDPVDLREAGRGAPGPRPDPGARLEPRPVGRASSTSRT